jgi:hypothetical protein
MHSDLINKIEKAKRYAQEPERFTIEHLEARFKGGDDHTITLNESGWACDCNFFHSWHTCSHVMAVQRLLAPMLSHDARRPGGPEYVSEQLLEAAG